MKWKWKRGLTAQVGAVLVMAAAFADGAGAARPGDDGAAPTRLDRALEELDYSTRIRAGGVGRKPGAARADAFDAGQASGSPRVAASSYQWVLPPGVSLSVVPAKADPELASASRSRSVFEPVTEEGHLDPDSFWKGWAGSIEGGINGSDGNSETFNLRFGAGLGRKTSKMETKLKSEYAYSTNNGEAEKNRWFTEARNDWSLDREDRWSFFVIGRLEYDDFQDWNWRASVFTGPGYKVIRTDKTLLNLRAGVGLTREFGGERNDLIPEGLLGADFEHQLTERQKLTATFEYYPSFHNLSQYRLLGRGSWEILVDPQVNMTLKLGFEDRYDSNPGEGFKKNDLDYFAMIVWKF